MPIHPLAAAFFFAWGALTCAPLHAASHPPAPIKLGDESLAVLLDPEFPRAIAYSAAGAVMDGQAAPVTAVELNGKPATCQVAFKQTGKNTAEYRVNFPDAKAQITLGVAVGKAMVEWRVTDIQDAGSFKIHSFAFPGNAMLTVTTAQPGASLATTFLTNTHDQYNTSFREFVGLIKEVKPGTDTGNYLFLSAGKLACGIACDNDEDVLRTTYTITEKDGIKSCAAQNPLWQIRLFNDEHPSLPCVKVFVTGDLNNDGLVNWQDAALVYRHSMPMPFGHEFIKTTVGENIAMNFASGAQQPFLKILDEIKKCALATDFLGQQVTIKGFSSEGHDSANTDYSGHYNERAGGMKDFNFLLDHAAEANARIGIHINASEVYPEALRYTPEILQSDAKGNPKTGWVWLDQAYMIDKVKDTRTGQLFASLTQMKNDLPNLGYIYLDTYWENAWPAAQIARKFATLKLPFGTEGCGALDPWTNWAHWREINSQIMRFIWFSDRDIFNNDAVLRAGRSDGDTFMGWQNQHHFHNFIQGTFSRHLPATYLANFELLSWTPNQQAQFSDGVKVVKSGESVTVTQNGRVVMTWTDGGSNSRLCVPWSPKNAEKIYVWDEVGTEQTWELPPTWANHKEVWLYKLTDQGRADETKVAVTTGRITLTVAKNTPFVLYQKPAPPSKMPDFGAGSLVKNPGFDSDSLADWNPAPTSAANVTRDRNGNAFLALTGEPAAEVSQSLTGLSGGKTYAASVWTQTKGQRSATLEVQCNGKTTKNSIVKSNVTHSAPNDPRGGSNYQRIQVLFDVPVGTTSARFLLKTSAGQPESSAEFDDVRIALTERSPESAKHFFWEDFEHLPFGGYGPFSCCPGERTHLSEAHSPHTHDTIHGSFSLKSRDAGRVARTLPSSLRFKPNTQYHLAALTLGAGHLTAESKGKLVLNLKFPNLPDKGVGKIDGTFATTNDTESYLGLFRDDGSDFIVIDDLAIDEIGPAPIVTTQPDPL